MLSVPPSRATGGMGAVGRAAERRRGQLDEGNAVKSCRLLTRRRVGVDLVDIERTNSTGHLYSPVGYALSSTRNKPRGCRWGQWKFPYFLRHGWVSHTLPGTWSHWKQE